MPGRAEYGLLAGLGQGMAQVGQMAYADHLQQMREARLAKIAADAADGKFARDKELLGIETANRREENQIKSDTDVKSKKEMADFYIGKGLGPTGKAAKQKKWTTMKSKDELGNEVITGVSDGSRFIDFNSEYGTAVKALLDKGADAETAISKATDWLALKGGAGGGAANNSNEEPGAQPPTRGENNQGNTANPEPGLLGMARDSLSDFWYRTDPLMLRSGQQSSQAPTPQTVDPRFKALQDRLNSSNPNDRRITNQQTRNFP